MRLLYLLIVVFLIAAFSKPQPSNPEKTSKPIFHSPDSSYSGDAELIYSVDGRKVDIKDYLVTGGKNWIALFLNEVSENTETSLVTVNLTNYLTKEVFHFVVADKGSTTFTHFQPSLANFRGKTATYMSPKYQNYYGDDVTVVITGRDNKHVTGTFLGKFKAKDGKIVQIEGRFDTPYKKGIS
jgi:hypothetical protein